MHKSTSPLADGRDAQAFRRKGMGDVGARSSSTRLALKDSLDRTTPVMLRHIGMKPYVSRHCNLNRRSLADSPDSRKAAFAFTCTPSPRSQSYVERTASDAVGPSFHMSRRRCLLNIKDQDPSEAFLFPHDCTLPAWSRPRQSFSELHS
jgi:hypothetical protein